MATSSNDGSQLTDRSVSCKENGPGGCTLDRPNISEWSSPMPDHLNITPELLRQLLRYEPDTGKLFWQSREDGSSTSKRFNKIFAERSAGRVNSSGYVKLSINGRIFPAHRIAWMMHYGSWPDGQIDHENGCRSDNRICNIRCVTPKENSMNKKVSKKNTSGFIGVHWNAKNKKWIASISDGNKCKYIGSYKDVRDAVTARLSVQSSMGYHKNHGART